MCWCPEASSPATALQRKPKNQCRRLVLYLAAVRAGAVYLPLNTAYTLNELEYFIGDAEPSLVVCDPSKAEGIGTIARKGRRQSRDAGRRRPGIADGCRRQGKCGI